MKAQLTTHLLTHAEEKPFKCQVCGRGFIKAQGLVQHSYTHTNDYPFKCNICDKGSNIINTYSQGVYCRNGFIQYFQC